MNLMALMQAAAQASVGTVQTAMASATDNPSATLGLAVVIPFLLQMLKNASWFPWLSRHTSQLNFAVGVIAASASVIGIHASYDMSTGGTITLPPLHTIWQAFIQWAGQQVAYKGLVVPAETLGEIRSLLERVLTPPPISEGAAKAGEGTQP